MTRHEGEIDVELMLEHDGEREAQVDIPHSEETELKRRAIAEVSELMQTYFELEVDDAAEDLAGLWGRIEGQLEQPASTAGRTASADSPGLFERIAEWLGVHRGHFVTGAVTAAVVLIVMLATDKDSAPERRAVVVPEEPPVVAPVSAPVASTPPEIESLEVYQGSGTILSLPGDDGDAPSAVIWLTPSDAEETLEGPI